MPVVAALRSPSPDVGPDEELVCELSVRNTGAIVDQFHLEVLGPAQDWTTLEPSVLSLFPNGQQVAQVKVRPPRAHTTPTGEIPLAVKVTPANDAGESVVEETVLNVAAFEDVEAELLPRISTGRISGRHRLAVDSRGNHPLTVKLSASDPANGLRIALTPPALVLQPGRASLARVKVRPRQRFYRGAIRQRPFKVAITPKDAEPVVVDGVFAQRPVLPKGVLILLVIAALVAAWFFLIKPAVHNTAVNAVSQPLTAQKAQNNALASGLQAANSNAAAAANKASAANSQAAAANGNAAAANKALAKIAAKPPPSVVTIPPAAPAAPAQINIPASKPPSVVVQTPTTKPPPPTTTTTTVPPAYITVPERGQLEVVAKPGATGTSSVVVPANESFAVDQVTVENVNSTAGQARLQVTGGGQPAQSVLNLSLAGLTSRQLTFSPAVNAAAGQTITLSVSCAANQPACDVAVSLAGKLSEPMPTSGPCAPAAAGQTATACQGKPLVPASGAGQAPGKGSLPPTPNTSLATPTPALQPSGSGSGSGSSSATTAPGSSGSNPTTA